jgi:hypothetical protein
MRAKVQPEAGRHERSADLPDQELMRNLKCADAFCVNVKTPKNILAIASVVALAVPAGVSAKGPSEDQAKPHTKTTHVSKRCRKQPKVGFVVGGTLDASSTADNIVVVVTKTNKHSKVFVVDGKYTVPAGSTVKYEGANPFTTQDADLTKYKVQVIGKVIKKKKGCTDENSPAPTVRKVTIHAPEATPEQEGAAQAA